MVRRVLSLVYKEVQGLHQAAYILALFAFSSQLLALVRDRLLAHQFGAGGELDIYYAAFRIPDVLYVLFASVLSVYVLIPFVSARQREGGNDAARALLDQVFSVFLLCYSVVALLVFAAAPLLAPLIFPGFDGQIDELVLLLRILLLQPLLLGMSSLYGVVTQLGHRFVLYAISPLLYNVGIIFGVVALYPLFGLAGIAGGVVLGAFGHLLVQVPLVRKSGLAFSLTTRVRLAELKPVLAVSIPRALTLSLNQIVLLGLVGIASVMATGSIAVFQFAYNLHSVPLSVIGVSYSVAAFPILAQLAAAKELEKFRAHVLTALRHIIFWSLPAIVLCIVLRAQLVRVVFGSGAFDWSDTRLTAAVFAVLVISIVAQAILLLFIRASYAVGNTVVPLVVSAVGAVLSLGGGLVLYWWYQSSPTFAGTISGWLRIDTITGGEVLVIALAYTFSLLLQAGVFLLWVRYRLTIAYRGLLRSTAEATLAAMAGGACAYASLHFFSGGVDATTFLGILLQGGLSGIAGLAGAAATYYAVGSQEFYEITHSFRRRVFKTDFIAPQEERI